ncbi:N-acetyltransferase [Frigoribacterium sp. VKM Ac-2836]|uniref:GNAT family N-acetyltransferase n=1 Tax=Frigoribacterium sp. VKM Ac-2836 TaxID=2739014 RepID=UPI00156729D7|nr:N-acetyltransferase [Frigoribacterium sp. VKM Ac-2836]NRD27587.1 GNAT family N-acetyltransferase [Frigoribacterium sp. VKM Ac-2836]
MPRFRETDVSSPDAAALLTEYFAERESTFPSAQGRYTTTLPDATAFVPPTGVFVVVDDGPAGPDSGAASGPRACGGIRLIAPSASGAVRYEVKHLYVRPTGRAQGLGRALLDELERRAAAFGADEIVLDTNDSLAAAGGLYRSAGYTTIEPYNANPNATTWYGKAVTGGTETGTAGR